MEEQKKESKVVELNTAEGKQQDGTQEKLSYEKLNEIAVQLSNENRYLKQQLQRLTEALNTVNRMDYLLKIVEIDRNSRRCQASFDTEFVESCIGEIQKLMTLPKKETADEDTKEGEEKAEDGKEG